MSNQFTCEFCDKIFSSKSNLTTHKNKAKYCISKRLGHVSLCSNESHVPINHKCSFCDKCFTSRQVQLYHESRCVNKSIIDKTQKYEEKILLLEDTISEKDKLLYSKDVLIENLQKQVNNLQEQLTCVALEGVRKTTKITNNTNTTNNVTQILSPFDLDQKAILSIIEKKLDETSFLNSQRGIAKFCVDNILKTEDGKMRMICTDPSRERFKYIDENGVIKEDIQARQFIEKIYPPIHQVGEKIHDNILEQCKSQHIKIAKGEDSTDKYMVKVKEDAAYNSWTDIRCMKHHNSNGVFRKELAILSNV